MKVVIPVLVIILFIGCSSHNGAKLNTPASVSYGKVLHASPTEIKKGVFRNKKAISYLIEKNDGRTFKLVSEKTDITEGACVAISRTGDKTEIEAVKPELCDRIAKDDHPLPERPVSQRLTPCQKARERARSLPPGPRKRDALRDVSRLCD
jgi:hypothetical protein